MNSNLSFNLNGEVRRGYIFWADLDEPYGSEQGGKRPVLVVQNDIANKFSRTTQIVPLTSKVGKRRLPTHVYINAYEFGLKKDSIALGEQMRTIDKKRLGEIITKISDDKMSEVINALKISIAA